MGHRGTGVDIQFLRGGGEQIEGTTMTMTMIGDEGGDDKGGVEEHTTTQAPVGIKTAAEKNGISFRDECHRECFPSSTKKCCRKIKDVPLNNIGDYVLFPADTLHRGFFMASDDVLVTAQLFCGYCNKIGKSMRSETVSIPGITTGRIEVSPELSTSVCINWDDDYPEEKFSPMKQFQLGEVDLKQNRYIKSIHLGECKPLDNLVEQFMLVFPFLNVESVWLIRKENEGDGFQGWHRDMANNATSAYTIVVNLGAVEVKAVVNEEAAPRRRLRRWACWTAR